MNKIRIFFLAVKYWLQGDEWTEAVKFARMIVKWERSEEKMKKLIIICLLLASVACACHKPVATPEEVNNYLIKITERSIIDSFSG